MCAIKTPGKSAAVAKLLLWLALVLGLALTHHPTPPSAGGHLRGHPADGGHVIASADKVPGVVLQLEVAQPLADGLCILQHTHTHLSWLLSGGGQG